MKSCHLMKLRIRCISNCPYLRDIHFMVLLACAICSPQSHATPAYWATNASGQFNDAANWRDIIGNHFLPDSNDSCSFARGTDVSYNVSFPGIDTMIVSLQEIRVGANNVTFLNGNNIFDSRIVLSDTNLDPLQRALLVGGGSIGKATLTSYVDIRAPSATIGVTGPGELHIVGKSEAITTLSLTATSTVHDALNVGFQASGLLRVSDGGILVVSAAGQISYTSIATHQGTRGQIDIVDNGRFDMGVGELKVGDNGEGFLNIAGNSLVYVDNTLLGTNTFSARTGSGHVTIDGSTLQSYGRMDIGVASADRKSDLTLLNNGFVSVSEQLSVGAQGEIRGTGLVLSESLVNQGVISPGTQLFDLHLAGRLQFLTDFFQTGAGRIRINLGGTTPATLYDQVLVSGTSLLSGVLDVVLANNFTPVAGDSFDILDLGTVTGAFGSVNLPTLPPNLTWNTSQLYSTGIISVVGPVVLQGDYDNNGSIDAADYVLWRNGGPLQNDATAGVQAEDYEVWKTHFGQTAGSGSTINSNNTSVPEPASISMLLTTTLVLLCWRQRTLCGFDKPNYR